MKRFRALSLIALILNCIIYVGCQRQLEDPGPDPTTPPPVQIEYVKAEITGRIVDDQHMPVSGAAVKVGSVTAATDINGEFKLPNVKLNKDAGFVKVEKDGFFQGSRTFSVTENSTHYVSIQLIKKNTGATFSGSSGGNVTVANGGSISFPAGAVVNQKNNNAYTADVTVHAYLIDPTSDHFRDKMPGILRGINAANQQVGIRSFGVMAVELIGANGEKLQLASGKKATITLPVPTSLQGQAPATIPLWHFNDTTGLWNESGTATKLGNNYVGEVSHFSFWDWGPSYPLVNFTATIKDQAGAAVPNRIVVIKVVNEPWDNGADYTDSLGQVSGKLPANKLLALEIWNQCYEIIHTQNIGPFSTDANLGNIAIPYTDNTVTITGAIETCSGDPVTNGYVTINMDNTQYATLVNNGSFSIVVDRCTTAPTTAVVRAFDLVNAQESAAVNVAVNSSTVSTGSISACASDATEFIDFVADGQQYHLIEPADTLFWNVTGADNYVRGYLIDIGDPRGFGLRFTGTGVGTFPISTFSVDGEFGYYVKSGTMEVNITEYGPAGGYIAGTISGIVEEITYPQSTLQVTASFRVKREP